MAAKRTSELIPLCHPLPLTDVAVALTPDAALPGVRVEVTARTVGKTGVEMEALTGSERRACSRSTTWRRRWTEAMMHSDISLAEKVGWRWGATYARA